MIPRDGTLPVARTLIEKIWDAHTIVDREGECLLWVDRHYIHEGSHHAFAQLASSGSAVTRPDLTFGFADHYVSTRTIDAPGANVMVDRLSRNAAHHGIAYFGPLHPLQGIAHVAAPESGLSLPGLLIVCGDSHTSTHGAVGALAFGIGASEVAHVLETQTIWQARPRQMRITVSGRLAQGVSAKDLALHIIATCGLEFAAGFAVEYCGTAVQALSIEGRMTLCNMSIEFGSRFGIVAPDDKLFDWLRSRPLAPRTGAFGDAVEAWRALASDQDARFDREVCIDANMVEPSATWGVTPEQAAPISGRIPDPARESDPERAAAMRQALDYMQLAPGTRITDIAVGKVFIGSCTNGRIEDLRIAAGILKGKRVKVPGFVSPGSAAVKQQAEREGLDAIFKAAGLEWVGSGCSMCVGMNGDQLATGERCASTTNRNFRGRQGKGSRTHLVSPAMAAASALAGRLADPRDVLEGTQP